MRKPISTLILLLVAAPVFAGGGGATIAVPEVDGTSALIGIAILAGVLGLIKERSRRK